MSGKPIIYQMMTRLFGNKVSVNKKYGTISENGVGKFDDINAAALDAIRALGATHIWYTGVLEHALLTDYTVYGIPPDDADVVKGRAGSPYAIKDYYDVDPDLAVNVHERMREFQDLVARTHRHGMKVIIDFVPNHVARRYHQDLQGAEPLGHGDNTTVAFAPNNNFYYLPGTSFSPPAGYQPLGDQPHPTKDGRFVEVPAKATGSGDFNASPEIDSWFETVKLNYGVDIQNGGTTHFDPIPDTWWKMRDILRFWAAKNVDGFRCDMAEMVPVEFWQWVIPQVKEVSPDLIFIAEIYNPSQYKTYVEQGRFDYLYDKVLLYDQLRLLVGGKGSTANIHAAIGEVTGIEGRILRFLENHDEQRIASRFFAGNAWHGLPAMVVTATIGTGPVMIYFGQEVGEPALGSAGFQNDDGRTTIFDYWGVPEHQKWMNGGRFDGGLLSAAQRDLRAFYARLLTLAATNVAIVEGAYADLTAYNIATNNFSSHVHAFLRFSGNERLLILTSFSEQEQDATVQIPENILAETGLDALSQCRLVDLLGSGTAAELRDGSFSLALPARACFVFKIQPEPPLAGDRRS